MNEKNGKKSIYKRTFLGLFVFYLIMMLVFTVIYEQILLEKTETLISGRMAGTISNLKSNLPKYMALKNAVGEEESLKETTHTMVGGKIDTTVLWEKSEENIMHDIVRSMSELHLYMGDTNLYGKSALFTDKKELLAKSGVVLSVMEDIPYEDTYIAKYRDIYLEDYLTIEEIVELARLEEKSRKAVDNANIRETYKEYDINLTGYIQGNTILPKEIKVIENTYRLSSKEEEFDENGGSSLSYSGEQIDSKVNKIYDLNTGKVKGANEREFTKCQMSSTNFPIYKGGRYESISDYMNIKTQGITENLLRKLAWNNTVERPEILKKLDKEKIIVQESHGIWKRDILTIIPFQSDKESYYLAYKAYFYPWLAALKALFPVYLFSFILVLIIGLILCKRLYGIYEKQIALESNRRRLTDAIAHELKTPLALISAYSEGLKENINDKKDHYIDIIIDETQKMDQMIVEMLLLSKLENGVVPLHFETVMMKEFILNEMKKYEKFFKDKDITFALEELQPCMIKCDREHMKKVMNNLISNAIYYCAEGGRITITLSDNRFEIFNTGDPIPEEKLTKVWDSFYKVDDSRNKERNNGTGLGLAIVKNILELHDLQYGIKNVDSGIVVWFAKK